MVEKNEGVMGVCVGCLACKSKEGFSWEQYKYHASKAYKGLGTAHTLSIRVLYTVFYKMTVQNSY